MSHETICLMALELAIGEQANGRLCPFCEGGQHNDHSFSMMRVEEGILYHCFRAKCNKSGFIKSKGLPSAKKKLKLPQLFLAPTRAITTEERQYLQNKYELTNKATYHYTFCDSKKRFVFPITNINGTQIGTSLKDDYGQLKDAPKWLHYFDDPELPHLHIRVNRQEWAVIVEDTISCDKLWELNVPAIALLGTDLSVDDAIYIRKLGIKTLSLALDPDARDKMHKIYGKYSLLFDEITMKYWKQDIKDTPKAELSKAYGEQNTVGY